MPSQERHETTDSRTSVLEKELQQQVDDVRRKLTEIDDRQLAKASEVSDRLTSMESEQKQQKKQITASLIEMLEHVQKSQQAQQKAQKGAEEILSWKAQLSR